MKSHPLVKSLLVLVATFLYGTVCAQTEPNHEVEFAPSESMPDRSDLDVKIHPQIREKREVAKPTDKAHQREITPRAAPRIDHGAGVFLTADYILWKLTQDGMEFAQTGFATSANFAGNTNATQGEAFFPGFHWESGFKVGLGLHLNQDGWDLFSEYTWLRTRSSNAIGSSNSEVVGVTFSALDSTSGAHRSTSTQRHHYNVINLGLGRNFYISEFLKLRPHFGLSGTWQRVKWNTDTEGIDRFTISPLDAVSPIAIRNATQKARENNRYWGIGIRGGLETAWHFTSQWSLFANLAWTTMWSSYSLSHEGRVSGTDISSNMVYTNLVIENIEPKTFYRVKFVNEAELGLRWEIWFYDDSYHFAAQVGWSQTVWVNHMTFFQSGESDTYNDLHLHGLDVKFRFDF